MGVINIHPLKAYFNIIRVSCRILYKMLVMHPRATISIKTKTTAGTIARKCQPNGS